MTSKTTSATCNHCNGYGNCPAGFTDSAICTTCDVRGRKSVNGRCRPCRGSGKVKGSLERQASNFPGWTPRVTPSGVGQLTSPLAVQGSWTVEPGGYGGSLV